MTRIYVLTRLLRIRGIFNWFDFIDTYIRPNQYKFWLNPITKQAFMYMVDRFSPKLRQHLILRYIKNVYVERPLVGLNILYRYLPICAIYGSTQFRLYYYARLVHNVYVIPKSQHKIHSILTLIYANRHITEVYKEEYEKNKVAIDNLTNYIITRLKPGASAINTTDAVQRIHVMCTHFGLEDITRTADYIIHVWNKLRAFGNYPF
jgi:hypothetical protein